MRFTHRFHSIVPMLLAVSLAACERGVDAIAGVESEPTFAATATSSSTGKFGTEYYGNWCGPSWSGGVTGLIGTAAPIDNLDRACKDHDLAYDKADKTWAPKYAAANWFTKFSVCSSWKTDYTTANNTLARVARNLPGVTLLIASMQAGQTPDVWGYNSNTFGPMPRTALQRDTFRNNVVAVNALQLFKKPAC